MMNRECKAITRDTVCYVSNVYMLIILVEQRDIATNTKVTT